MKLPTHETAAQASKGRMSLMEQKTDDIFFKTIYLENKEHSNEIF